MNGTNLQRVLACGVVVAAGGLAFAAGRGGGGHAGGGGHSAAPAHFAPASGGMVHPSAGMIHPSAAPAVVHSSPSAGMVHPSAGMVHPSAGMVHPSAAVLPAVAHAAPSHVAPGVARSTPAVLTPVLGTATLSGSGVHHGGFGTASPVWSYPYSRSVVRGGSLATTSPVFASGRLSAGGYPSYRYGGGYRPYSYYGYGLPYWSGIGLGGFGIGFGYGSGPGWGFGLSFASPWGGWWGGYGNSLGYGGYGLGGYGYSGYGYGNGYGLGGYGSGGYGLGGYVPSGYGLGGSGGGWTVGGGYQPGMAPLVLSSPPLGGVTLPSPTVPSVLPQTVPQPLPVAQPPATTDTSFLGQADRLFRDGDFTAAARAYQHAAVDDPKNPAVALRGAMALAAAGRYDEAAGAIQQGLTMLPPEKWLGALKEAVGAFGSTAAADASWQAILKAADAPKADPGVRFLAGAVAAGRGDFTRAAADLKAVIAAAPQDTVAQTLADLIAKQPK